MDYRKARLSISIVRNSLANRFLNLAILTASFTFAALVGISWGVIFYLVASAMDFYLYFSSAKNLRKL